MDRWHPPQQSIQGRPLGGGEVGAALSGVKQGAVLMLGDGHWQETGGVPG